MSITNFSRQKKIPKLTTRKSAPMTTNFAKGVYTYKPNDTMGLDELRLAQDARFDRVGEYGTRLGYKRLKAGQTLDTPIGWANSSRGSSSAEYWYVNGSELRPGLGYGYGSFYDETLCAVSLYIYKPSSDTYVVPKITLTVDGEGEIASACIRNEDIPVGGSLISSTTVFFNEAPTVAQGKVVRLAITAQTGSLDDIRVSAFKADGDNYYARCNFYKCTPGQVESIFETNIGGDRSIFFTFNEKLYWRSSAGVISVIRTLPVGTKRVRFSQNLNQVRYTDGKEEAHRLAPTITNGVVTAWLDISIPMTDLKTGTNMTENLSNIMTGTADNLIYFSSAVDTKAVWTYPYGYTFAKSPSYSTTATISGAVGTTLTINLTTISPSGISTGDWITGQGTATAEVTGISGNNVYLRIVDTTPQTISSYDKFSIDFYQNFPAIKTGDPLTAMFNLGGVLYMMTRRNKYQMFMQTAESWSQNASNAQNGTFSQESVVCDLNYAYFANENGIYAFDGASEWSLTEKSIQNVYDNIPNKEQIVMDMYKNRLYVYYPSTAGGANDSCLVYNINLKVWESFDSKTFVSATSARQNSSSRFICGHSKIGLLMINEDATDNDYSDMGAPIAFNLETAYEHYGSTSQLKRVTKWRPEFAATTKPYTCECGYALDFTDQVEYAFSIDLQSQNVVNIGYIWDNPSDYGVPAVPTIHTTIPQVNGEFYRIQIRYQHIAAFEPVIFRSHTLTVQTQRIR